MKKRAQSGIIVTVLLILIVLATIVIVSTIIFKTIETSKKEISKSSTCLKNIDFEIINACYNETDSVLGIWEIKILLKNKENIGFNESFILHITEKGATDKIPLPHNPIKKLEQKLLIASVNKNPENATEFLLIPRVREGEKAFNCYERNIKFEPKKCK